MSSLFVLLCLWAVTMSSAFVLLAPPSTATSLFRQQPWEQGRRTTSSLLEVSMAKKSSKKKKKNASVVVSDEASPSPQDYFRDRIAAARQRALLASLAKSDQQHATTMKAIVASKTPTPATKEEEPSKPLSMDAASVAARQSYFQERIQQARQRALLANIQAAKQAQTRTTDTLKQQQQQQPRRRTISSTTLEARQRALLAAQLSYSCPVQKAAKQRQEYFRNRIQFARQRTLLANIVATTAAQQQTTATLKGSSSSGSSSSSKKNKNNPAFVSPFLPAGSTSLQQDKGAASSTNNGPVSQQDYFKQRIEASRQRVLLSNIATAKAEQKLTTDTLKGTTTASSNTKVPAQEKQDKVTTTVAEETVTATVAVVEPVPVLDKLQANLTKEMLPAVVATAVDPSNGVVEKKEPDEENDSASKKEEPECLQTKCAAIDCVEERAYTILKDLGMV